MRVQIWSRLVTPCFLLAVVPSLAAPITPGTHTSEPLITGLVFTFPDAQPPVDIVWELATAADARVSFSLPMRVTGINAVQQNYWADADGVFFHVGANVWEPVSGALIDWPAWQLAVSDPAYDRAIIRFGNATLELPAPRAGSGTPDAVLLRIDDWAWPNDVMGRMPAIRVSATRLIPVPEPGGWWPAIVIGSVLHGLRSRRRLLDAVNRDLIR